MYLTYYLPMIALYFVGRRLQCERVLKALEDYEWVSGQKINTEKTSLYFSKNTSMEVQEQVKQKLGAEIVRHHEKYLGLPPLVGRGQREAFHRKPSKMSVFKLPDSLCKDLNSMMGNFWWGQKGKERRKAWVSWENLCKPKSEGGMGFRDLKAFNLALLAKQGWRIMEQPNSLVHRVYKAKYFAKELFLNAQVARKPTYVWRSIMAARDVIKKGSWWYIGNGRKVHIWNDRWIPRPNSTKLVSPWRAQYKVEMVSDLIDIDRRGWDAAKVRSILMLHKAEIVLGIPISYRLPDDSVIWAGTTNGNFTVKSAYWVAQNCLKEGSSRSATGCCSYNTKMKAIWKMVWNLKCPSKIKCFIWRAYKNILPTRNRLS